MSKKLRIALAQINVTVGDLVENERKIKQFIHQASKYHADLIAFPELTITGYPPEDLLLRSHFIQDNKKCLHRIAKATQNITAIIGFVDRNEEQIFNAAAVICDGKTVGAYHKIHLPNYGVFDEKRYFVPGNRPLILELKDIKIGLNICEDIWVENSVIETQALTTGAEIILNISSSPYHAGKEDEREILLKNRAVQNRVYVCYVNLVGGQDELVFDGNSLIVNEQGNVLRRGKQFEEDLILFDVDVKEIAASLGIALVHSPPYRPQGRGKVERWFRTVRTEFLTGFRGQTLAELNESLEVWVREVYHRRLHRSTGEEPLRRFASKSECLRSAPLDLEDHFRKRARRRVAKDRTVALDGRLYEAPVALVGAQIMLLYHPHDPARVEALHEGRTYGMLRPVDLHVNCRVRRRRDEVRLEVEPRPISGGRLSFAKHEETSA